ncbi:cytosolic endo-beta-N-acetylglucosaminidase 1-like [Tasmannia lanceolata]|uniref:cytosolic endo-beta-N-acetylglucosaminidase 1-like n=1 Tax=Tasmannia lanceolata TaxID=3420 RepID=UPI004064BAAF
MQSLLIPFIKRNVYKITPLKTLLKTLHHLFLAMTRSLNSSQNEEDSSQNQPNSTDPPFDPSKPSTPISFPITKLEDLNSRSYFNSFHFPFNKSSVPLPSYVSSKPSRPRLLVCHDMAGGYLNDKWIQGGTNAEAYAIWHWYLIDVFVYFSHNLVTIPPPCWTNAAHTHGVKVLGTFITEWDAGEIIANTLLSTKESAQMYAERLTELAVALGFDGWLLNMEVNLDTSQIPNLKEFVSHLTETMHSALPGSLVIWYDSVTKDGDLSWQNQLNEYNKPFFDLCDGIFVNYSWLEDYPKLSAAVAGERKFDVYMGIDVFGRNTFGGGQWNTNVALDVLKKDDVSAALFAPGWVYETKQKPDFQTAQNRWWGLVEKSWGILQNYPKILPFYSNFDQGHGYHISIEGLQVSTGPWCNISCQNFQPVLDGSTDPIQSTIQVSRDFKDPSYSGGASITFKGTIEGDTSITTRLFQGELSLGDSPINITHSVILNGGSRLGLALGFSNSSTNTRTSVLLVPGGLAFLGNEHLRNKYDKVIMQLQIRSAEREDQKAAGWVLQETSIQMKGYTLTDIHSVCYMEGKPTINKNISHPDTKSDTSSSSSHYNASLGHISIQTLGQNMEFPPATSWVVEGQDISWASGSQGTKTLSLKIVWQLKEGSGDNSLFLNYNIYVRKSSTRGMIGEGDEYIGIARVEAFYISNLIIPPNISGLVFTIQVCGLDGACQKLGDSPKFQLGVKDL